MLTGMHEEKYSMVEIFLFMGSSVFAPLPLIVHTFLCLLFLTAWVERLNRDLQNIFTFNTFKIESDIFSEYVQEVIQVVFKDLFK